MSWHQHHSAYQNRVNLHTEQFATLSAGAQHWTKDRCRFLLDAGGTFPHTQIVSNTETNTKATIDVEEVAAPETAQVEPAIIPVIEDALSEGKDAFANLVLLLSKHVAGADADGKPCITMEFQGIEYGIDRDGYFYELADGRWVTFEDEDEDDAELQVPDDVYDFLMERLTEKVLAEPEE